MTIRWAKRRFGSRLLFLGLFIQLASSCSGQTRSPEVGEVSGDGWISLFNGENLEGWEPTRFGGEGNVEARDGAIVLELSGMLTGITWQQDFPTQDYEIALEARRVLGTDFFCGLTFPVREEFCSLIVGGWGGSLVGLSSIDGMDASENDTTVVLRLESGRWYEIRLRVEADRIQAWIDDQLVIDADIEGADLSVRPEVRLSRPLGIASWQTTAALRKIRYRLLEK